MDEQRENDLVTVIKCCLGLGAAARPAFLGLAEQNFRDAVTFLNSLMAERLELRRIIIRQEQALAKAHLEDRLAE